MKEVVDSLRININFKDEWPSRVAEFISDLAQWYVSHPSLSEVSVRDVATFLESVAFKQGGVHETSPISINRDSAGKTGDTVESVIDFDHLCGTLALAAFKRYGHCNAA